MMATHPRLVPGTHVKLQNLVSKPQLNGRAGLFLKVLEGPGRCEVKDVETGECRSVKLENLGLRDALLEFLDAHRLADEDECDVFSAKVKKTAKKVSPVHSFSGQGGSFVRDCVQKEGEKLKTPGDSVIIVVDLAALGHHFLLELVSSRVSPEEGRYGHLSARVVQGWVKTSLGGYSVGEWLTNRHASFPAGTLDLSDEETRECWAGFGWMQREALANFCDRVDALKSTLDRLTREHLLPGAGQFCDVRSRGALNAWASREKVKGASAGVGLTLQPGKLEMVDDYCEGMRADGFPEHAVVFTGVTAGNPVQLLDFPVKALRQVMILVRALFAADVSGATFLSALEWHGNPLAWSYSIVEEL
jgi:hypothetical protein